MENLNGFKSPEEEKAYSNAIISNPVFNNDKVFYISVEKVTPKLGLPHIDIKFSYEEVTGRCVDAVVVLPGDISPEEAGKQWHYSLAKDYPGFLNPSGLDEAIFNAITIADPDNTYRCVSENGIALEISVYISDNLMNDSKVALDVNLVGDDEIGELFSMDDMPAFNCKPDVLVDYVNKMVERVENWL